MFFCVPCTCFEKTLMLLVRNYVQQISDYIPKMYKALVSFCEWYRDVWGIGSLLKYLFTKSETDSKLCMTWNTEFLSPDEWVLWSSRQICSEIIIRLIRLITRYFFSWHDDVINLLHLFYQCFIFVWTTNKNLAEFDEILYYEKFAWESLWWS